MNKLKGIYINDGEKSYVASEQKSNLKNKATALIADCKSEASGITFCAFHQTLENQILNV